MELIIFNTFLFHFSLAANSSSPELQNILTESSANYQSMAAAKYCSSPIDSRHVFQESFTRKRKGCFNLCVKQAQLSGSNAKRANLSARKKERVKLPDYGNCISEFFTHPSGIESVLNKKALRSYESVGSNLYRCVLPQIQLLTFRVEPVLELQVTPTSEDCLVEMLSCKFEGSEVVERQNKHFLASMRNHMKWETIDADQFLDVDVTLNINLEIYTPPFNMLPVSAVEGPGNIVMQALVDQFVPLLVKQLLQDYEEWIRQHGRPVNI